MTPECTDPTTSSALERWTRLRSLRAPGAGLDSVSSVASSTLRPAMPPPLLIRSTAALAALSCQKPQDEMTPVKSQWCPITIGPEACASRSLVIVRLAVPASAPPPSAVSRKLRRDSFPCFIRVLLIPGTIRSHSLRQAEVTVHDLRLRFQIVRRAVVDDGTLLHQEDARA